MSIFHKLKLLNQIVYFNATIGIKKVLFNQELPNIIVLAALKSCFLT